MTLPLLVLALILLEPSVLLGLFFVLQIGFVVRAVWLFHRALDQHRER